MLLGTGGVEVLDTTALGLVANDYVVLEGEITIAATGGSGAFHHSGLIRKMVGSTPSEDADVQFDTTVDTTAALDLTFECTQSANHADNQTDFRELEAWAERAGTVAVP